MRVVVAQPPLNRVIGLTATALSRTSEAIVGELSTAFALKKR
jgi:hypothetical protein